MSEKTLRAVSLVAGYSSVMEDDYSCTTAADLCDLGRETMDWIIENSNHQNVARIDNDNGPCGGGGGAGGGGGGGGGVQQIKQEDEAEDEGERILLELGIVEESGQFAGRQVSELCMSQTPPMPSILYNKIQ